MKILSKPRPIGFYLPNFYRSLIKPNIILFIILTILTSVSAQINQCEIELPALVADETLCDDYYDIVTSEPDYFFGGSITMASQFTGDITGTIVIATDFKVDRPLRIYDAIIYVRPGRKIYIQDSHIGVGEGYSNFNGSPNSHWIIVKFLHVMSCGKVLKSILIQTL